VGSDNEHLSSYNNGSYNSASDRNYIPFGSLFTADLSELGTLGLTADGTGTDIGNLTTAEQDVYRPYPFYNHIYELHHNYWGTYNSLQVSWNKNTGMVQYGANYTFSKNLATAASYNNVIPDPVNLHNDYIPVPYDRTHTVNVNYLVDLSHLYKGGHKLLSEAANGWQISGISSIMSGFPLASMQGENFGFGYGLISRQQVEYINQMNKGSFSMCKGLSPDKNGHTYCVFNMNPTVWLGSPDIQLMPTTHCNPAGGPGKHQFINAACFGLPLPEANGPFRMPYIHGPAFMDHDMSLLKNFGMGKERLLQFRLGAFNFLNHPLTSFNSGDTTNLTLAFQDGTAGQPLTQTMLTHQNFGKADIRVGNRLLELGVKYEF
jgi:hypothetical protein